MALTGIDEGGGATASRTRTAALAPAERAGALARGSRSGLAVLGRSAAVFVIASLATFALGAASGSNPAAVALGDMATPEDIARLNRVYGLDRPFPVRYLDWLTSALSGDLGVSWFSGIPVGQSIAQAFPVSLSIALGAMLVAVTVGAGSGILAAVARGSAIDRLITATCAVLATIPAFVAGIALILIFALAIPLLPTGGYTPPQLGVAAWVACLVLPSIALSLDAAADLSRQLRTSLVGALAQNYVVGATVHGLGRSRIVLVHALPNALAPAIATLGLHVPRLLGGAVITEAIFGMPGLGVLAAKAALSGDVPVVQGVLLVTVTIVIVSGIVVNMILSRVGTSDRSVA